MADFSQHEAALLALSRNAFMPEERAIGEARAAAALFRSHAEAVHVRAGRYIRTLRADAKQEGLQAFRHEYGLDSQEGIMMMCLAEALLRIPDAATADRLIHDKLAAGNWDSHIGSGRSWLLNAGGYGLELAGFISSVDKLQQTAGAFIGGLVHRLGEPVVRAALKHAVRLLGNVFVLGSNIEEAVEKAAAFRANNGLISFDMLGEGARSAAQAEEYFKSYMHAIHHLGIQADVSLHKRDSVSIKLSALHPRFELRMWERLQRELVPRVVELAEAAAQRNIMLVIDAEEARRLDVTLKLFTAVITDPKLAGYDGFGLAVQAYQTLALPVIGYLHSLAEQHGKRIPVRLVKGAYWDSEIKRAQQDGLSAYPVFTHKEYTDISYLACAAKLLAVPALFYPQFATHNARTVASIIEAGGDADYEFQRLHGMGEVLYEQVFADTDRGCRVYAPVGPSHSLLSYLIRRILENGANSSFVHGVADARVPVEQLIADPFDASLVPSFALPDALYAGRANSRGVDLGNAAVISKLYGADALFNMRDALLPANADENAVQMAIAKAKIAATAWKAAAVEQRVACLFRLADLFESHADELRALCIHEAGKTMEDAIAELRESVDFCRYYAVQAGMLFSPVALVGATGERNILTLHPRGLVVAISPWNFPLAIFTGQIVAALVTGNVVIAKPAEQTPRIAARAIALMHEAGIPADVVQLLCGKGEIVGQQLVSAASVALVCFTGSTQTAWAINRALAGRNAPVAPLIAETGGQNCMLVDSSALIEQTVDDIVVSAFGSAGQRCSALRVLFVQEEIADDLLTVLAGAVEQLQVGDPLDVATDIGPLIDGEAYQGVMRHVEHMHKTAKLVAASPLPQDAPARRLLAPHIFEIGSIAALDREVFGPVLHVIRYKAGALDAVIAQINSTGYGLTFGIQSRIDATINLLSQRVQAGNIYVNRPMTGAMVGVQPFGGNGLSGTGPKAGGPHYLKQFCVERTLSVNTAAVGGNLELLV